ncbi:MAG: hypothetical protein GY774_00395 [Planctomycetes bacterium]|nr:hypothetical protein [Planctomycetota bacterium]
MPQILRDIAGRFTDVGWHSSCKGSLPLLYAVTLARTLLELSDQRPKAKGQRPKAKGQRPKAKGQRPKAKGCSVHDKVPTICGSSAGAVDLRSVSCTLIAIQIYYLIECIYYSRPWPFDF